MARGQGQGIQPKAGGGPRAKPLPCAQAPPALKAFAEALSPEERRFMAQLDTPAAIQRFLDGLRYSSEPVYRCPLKVLREGKGHCFDGALFAAAALRRAGHPPLILDMLPNARDDDHVLALFKQHGHWGALAQSNFAGLRFREPVHRTLRELVLTYFEHYYNVAGEKTLRGYTWPLDLRRFDRELWMTCDEPLEGIAAGLDRRRRVELLQPAMVAGLSPVDERSLQAGLTGAEEEGLFRPPS